MKKFLLARSASIGIAVLTVAVMASSPATAQSHPAGAGVTHPNGCVSDSGYSITGHSSYFIGGSDAWKAGPGGSNSETVSAAKTLGASLTVTVGDSVGVELGIITNTAKVDVSGSITGSVTITTGHTYSHNITGNKYGNLQYGAWGYKVGWTHWITTGSCKTETLASGTALLPTNVLGWRYWETSS
jgi:hypothetical protein